MSNIIKYKKGDGSTDVGLIMTSADIFSGSSGGALANEKGQLVGLLTR